MYFKKLYIIFSFCVGSKKYLSLTMAMIWVSEKLPVNLIELEGFIELW